MQVGYHKREGFGRSGIDDRSPEQNEVKRPRSVFTVRCLTFIYVFYFLIAMRIRTYEEESKLQKTVTKLNCCVLHLAIFFCFYEVF